MKIATSGLALLLVLSSSSLMAAPAADAAGTCLTDNTTGRDRKDLMTWIYVAMSKHPEIRALSAATPQAVDEANRRVGALFTRLIASDCAAEFRAMVKEQGNSSISTAFEVLGRVAMTELMGHPDVSASIAELSKYADQQKINAVLENAQPD